MKLNLYLFFIKIDKSVQYMHFSVSTFNVLAGQNRSCMLRSNNGKNSFNYDIWIKNEYYLYSICVLSNFILKLST